MAAAGVLGVDAPLVESLDRGRGPRVKTMCGRGVVVMGEVGADHQDRDFRDDPREEMCAQLGSALPHGDGEHGDAWPDALDEGQLDLDAVLPTVGLVIGDSASIEGHLPRPFVDAAPRRVAFATPCAWARPSPATDGSGSGRG